jgi:hypothetical protein
VCWTVNVLDTGFPQGQVVGVDVASFAVESGICAVAGSLLRCSP